MALNDIKVPKENASGTFDETVLTPAQIGAQASGSYATLVNGLVPSNQLPSFVDDVLEYANLAAFPATGESGKIFVAIDTRKTYRWSGSAYVEISPSEVTSVAGRTGAITLASTDISGLGTAATKDTPATGNASSTQVVLGTDTRLSDTRDPKAHTHAIADLQVSPAWKRQLAYDGVGEAMMNDEILAPLASKLVDADSVTDALVCYIGEWTIANSENFRAAIGLDEVSNAAQVTSVTGTEPIVSSGGTTPAISISAATTSAAGSMSSADKTKLDGIATNANNYTHPNHSGDVTSAGDGATTIASNAVTNAKLAQVATSTLKGRATAATGNVEDLTAAQARGVLGLATTDNATFGSLQNTPIGSTTASTGSFTTLTATPSAGSALTLTGGTVTASTPLLDATQTWNNSAVTFTGLRFNATNTASQPTSLLVDLQTGGTSQFSVRRDGIVNALQQYNVAGVTALSRAGGFNALNGNYIIGWGATGFNIAGVDLTIERDAADIMAQRRSTNPQAFRIYNTWTSATNFERLNFAWSSNVAIIGTEKGSGGGTARALEFQTDATTRFTILSTGVIGLGASGSSSGLGASGLFVNTGAAQISMGSYLSSVQLYNQRVEIWGDNAAGTAAVIMLSCGKDLVRFGGTTSSFPALKRSSTVLQARLANDSDFCPLQGQLRTHANAVTETITADKTLTLYDAAGTAYKVPCVAA